MIDRLDEIGLAQTSTDPSPWRDADVGSRAIVRGAIVPEAADRRRWHISGLILERGELHQIECG